jgi:tetratricopeptide (TPR) repeat protein
MAAALATTPTPMQKRPRWQSPSIGKVLAVGGVAVIALLLWKPWAGDEPSVAAAGTPAWTILAEVDGSAPEDLRQTVWSLLSGEIDESGIVITLSDQRIEPGLRQALMPDTTRISVSVARELAVRGDVETVFAPILEQVGNTYALRLRVLHAERGEVLGTAQARTVDREGLVSAAGDVVDSLVSTLSAQAGVARRPRPTAITPSLEAFQVWRAGQDLYNRSQFREALRAYQKAIRLDPDFASAWLWMGVQYYVIGFPDSARWAIDEGLERPERLTGRGWLDAQWIDWFYRPGEKGQALHEIAQSMMRDYPSDRSYVYLALACVFLGRTDEAVRILKELETQSPFGLSGIDMNNLLYWLTGIGEFQEARERWLEIIRQTGRNAFGAYLPVSAAEWDEAERIALEAIRNPESTLAHKADQWRRLAAANAARGRVRDAVQALGRSLELEARPQNRLSLSRDLLTLLVASGSEPEDLGFSPIVSDTTPMGRELAGLWSLYRGDFDEAEEIAATMVQPIPDDPRLIPGIDAGRLLLFARLEGSLENWGAVTELLTSQIGEEVRRLDDLRPRLLVEWTVADAFENLGLPDSAAYHFDRLADPVGDKSFWFAFTERGLTHSFAHRRAALLYGRLGENDKAIEHWHIFLNDFTDPDPDYVWMVDEAREELARLEG